MSAMNPIVTEGVDTRSWKSQDTSLAAYLVFFTALHIFPDILMAMPCHLQWEMFSVLY